MASRLATPLDSVDQRILAELQRDGRLSFNELSRRVNLSAPAVADRVRRLTDRGVITGYHAHVDPAAAGLPVTALVRMECFGAHCLLRDEASLEMPEILQVHRVTGDDCCVLLIAVRSMEHFEEVIDRLAEHGRPSSTMVMSSPVPWRPVSAPVTGRP
ncbi:MULTISPECIES: Lrp/AsnC family transcriptional regulator [Nocardiopsis]|jgi:Lrp/AsnC family leucine-responsive transcriptional regulator|uniref:Transcriptional regulator, AsnC family n=1 Tax=Nocardiopsis dassonvillei (strain ATCC 23218 / DSM 43111 / CIP 107115 / JCM 7437 / KCTC 9190 / NBRC 14626 / NCTC 10488 / NRRL B-5397 / IMRU 509) TaxID=446468 RepID=D7AZD7_NOCDD|nr:MULTISPECIES: Lrp/AsnC family transcriptional regulator [Nocardiopsis]ADH66229.1 transcriptional regulator, AsnC family [Nocardiopsis dassonvillei subsp. dassonvillei DSM 43111]APC34554.1 AsnC family transcriptional regulator [Nocardiopsis dassonvillei]NKY78278.1 Lrp/AsnC family transcriptional regulator [Nocardiopsis dassonvillei]VEI92251.1 HTH-type transcriptional regulator lrpC [Nocardiopsis dassonvillei]